MHELSVAISIVQSITDATAAEDHGQIAAVNVRVGAMSGVIPEALQFAWTPATRDTPLQGSELRVEFIPAAIYCENCSDTVELPGQRLVCPVCQTRSPRLVRGRELDILSVELQPESQHAS
ncbi:hydrogenase maturation nickel metallochaperone HypA/HybF [Algisphaera agarilytica]|uniref:Hydrogenase maturation factor HypA n=1 Tax=Algisphaera agarilytica TaxID=1385975 RepID=A0A7X0LJ56_9BACT|nr:hydrogenase maturation nickel metallochaperone HypA [Algisphaera agarilytica]MBB6428251.1 hydrogenase nickel incorporation protein HypA/HybF [Algisphaera agarilytica]